MAELICGYKYSRLRYFTRSKLEEIRTYVDLSSSGGRELLDEIDAALKEKDTPCTSNA